MHMVMEIEDMNKKRNCKKINKIEKFETPKLPRTRLGWIFIALATWTIITIFSEKKDDQQQSHVKFFYLLIIQVQQAKIQIKDSDILLTSASQTKSVLLDIDMHYA